MRDGSACKKPVGRRIAWIAVVTLAAIVLGCSGKVLAADVFAPLSTLIPQRDYLAGDYDGIRTRLYARGVDLFANYQGEVFGTLSGGAVLDSHGNSKRIATYDGLLTFGVNLDFAKLTGWWTGAKLSFNVLQLHGSNLSQLAIGDLAGFSNIYGYNTIRLGEVFLEQALFDNRVRVQVGQMLSHDEFFGCPYEELFINGTLDEFTLLSANLPFSPLYPMATPAVKVILEPDKTFFFKGAIYSGSVQAQNANQHSVAVPISSATGAFLVSQVGFHVNSEDDPTSLPGTYRVGAFFHTRTKADVGYTPGAVKDGDFAVFAVADQMVWRHNAAPNRKGPALGVWTRIGGAPAVHNLVNFYVDGGLNLLAPLPGRDDDILGVGVAFTKVSEHGSRISQAAGGQRLDSETVFELTYQLQLAPWWQLQPDFQYYITPSAGVHAPNAAVLGMRTTITF